MSSRPTDPCGITVRHCTEAVCSGIAGANLSLTQAELPPLPPHALAGDAGVPRRLSKPFVPPRRAKGGGLSGPRVQASPAEADGAAGGSGGEGAVAGGGGNSEPAVVPDTQEGEQEAERAAHPNIEVAAGKGGPQRACSVDATAGLANARAVPPPVTACASASANPR